MKIFKKVMVLVFVVGMTLGLSACGNSSKSSDAASKNDDSVLVVGFDQNFPPFGYKNKKGKFVGFDIEAAKACAKEMGVDIKLQPIDWDSKDMELESGTIDCIWNGFTINGREKKYTWTEPYMNNYQVFVVKSDSGINTIADLKDKNVEVQKESSAETAINDDKDLKASFAQYTSVADYNTAMMDLDSGAADAVAMDYFVALDQTKGKDQFKILDEKLSQEQYAVGFEKGNTKLRDQVQKAMKKMVKDGTYAKLSEKYFGENVVVLSAD